MIRIHATQPRKTCSHCIETPPRCGPQLSPSPAPASSPTPDHLSSHQLLTAYIFSPPLNMKECSAALLSLFSNFVFTLSEPISFLPLFLLLWDYLSPKSFCPGEHFGAGHTKIFELSCSALTRPVSKCKQALHNMKLLLGRKSTSASRQVSRETEM